MGLKEDDDATILVYRVSRTEDGCYVLISPPIECDAYPWEPEPLVEALELSDEVLTAKMTSRGQVWGLLGDGLGGFWSSHRPQAATSVPPRTLSNFHYSTSSHQESGAWTSPSPRILVALCGVGPRELKVLRFAGPVVSEAAQL